MAGHTIEIPNSVLTYEVEKHTDPNDYVLTFEVTVSCLGEEVYSKHYVEYHDQDERPGMTPTHDGADAVSQVGEFLAGRLKSALFGIGGL